MIYVYVEDVDKPVERAMAGEAKVLFHVQNQFWGDRIGWVMDPSGHVWTIATRMKKPRKRSDRSDYRTSWLSRKSKPGLRSLARHSDYFAGYLPALVACAANWGTGAGISRVSSSTVKQERQ